jgi:hypothetical protein
MGAFHLTWFFSMIAARRQIERAVELMAEIDVLLPLPDLQLLVHRDAAVSLNSISCAFMTTPSA